MTISKIQKYLEEVALLNNAGSLAHWDMETMMPSEGIEARAKLLSYLSGKTHSLLTAKKYKSLLDSSKKVKLTAFEKKMLKELQWDYDMASALPSKHVEEISLASTNATHVWASARKNNDWDIFFPHLQKLIDLKKREATFYKAKTPYDALIRQFDKNFTVDSITDIFSDLRKGLTKLSKQVNDDGRFVKVKDLSAPFDINAQVELSKYITGIFGLPSSQSRLDISAHPFSTTIAPKDFRITTRYNEKDLDSFGSTMHEVGHALYEAGLPRDKWNGLPAADALSLSVHESQSRFWENIVGRSSEFCHFIHPKMKELFPSQMKGITPEKLFLIMNKSVPNLIRVESCELYYNLHVIIRFEIEKMIFNEGMDAFDIPYMWNELYEKYLGVRPKSIAEGAMQDSHWAGGAFGYFPTYTLGNLISGSLYQKMKREIKTFNQDIQKGEFSRILSYLRDNIHSHGRTTQISDIIGGEIRTKDYLDYLKEKFDV
jgi:carboxypeptidase Taq